MNEADTRAEYIEPSLAKAGWGVVSGSLVRREYKITKGRLIGYKRRMPSLIADYVLQYNNRILAVIEAKSTDKYLTDGLAQAKRYAEKLQLRFAFCSNGLGIYAVDMETGQEGEEKAFPSPQELWEKTTKRQLSLPLSGADLWTEKFLAVPLYDRGGLWEARYYQEQAINKVLEAVAQGQKRILLTLATGTGKTDIACQISWKLFQTKWNLQLDEKRRPRILFLADRNVLADQALEKFLAFSDDAKVRILPHEIRKKGQVPTNANVFFTIFQTFMSGEESEESFQEREEADENGTALIAIEKKERRPYFGEYPPDFFDFIIIDECHRGGANKESSWRDIMEYFKPAFQLGLTATPKRSENADTYAYFGEPVYSYSLKEGTNDGFLTPFILKRIQTNFDEYYFSFGDQVIGEIDKKRLYTQSDMERSITIEGRDERLVRIFMEDIDQDHKTLVFCKGEQHALKIRDIINRVVEIKHPDYCHRVTSQDGKEGEQYLKYFQDNEKRYPTILTTSHKLSTGVDAAEVRNIVLFREINSMIEFKQILGRGTRLFDGKDYFTVYDFVGADFHFNDPEWDGEPEKREIHDILIDTVPCLQCGKMLCKCELKDKNCQVCGLEGCVCEKSSVETGIARVQLAAQKLEQFDYTMMTTFLGLDNRPISTEDFGNLLSGRLSKIFQHEEELRKTWQHPSTRKRLLDDLAEEGFSEEQLNEYQKNIQQENSDLYDILNHLVFGAGIISRATRADQAEVRCKNFGQEWQKVFQKFLTEYLKAGHQALDDEKITPMLELQYQAIENAKRELGDVILIRDNFIRFQEYLYEEQ